MPLAASRFKNLRSGGTSKPPTFFAQRRQERAARKGMFSTQHERISFPESVQWGGTITFEVTGAGVVYVIVNGKRIDKDALTDTLLAEARKRAASQTRATNREGYRRPAGRVPRRSREAAPCGRLETPPGPSLMASSRPVPFVIRRRARAAGRAARIAALKHGATLAEVSSAYVSAYSFERQRYLAARCPVFRAAKRTAGRRYRIRHAHALAVVAATAALVAAV